eukprot:GHUV01023440.1.p1 GENE.GHUV01023440.1~~GHUV01023440.1.p1  ORF type:complete len:398 (+),score=114.81 GHUV01023440.1:326-1519(+)
MYRYWLSMLSPHNLAQVKRTPTKLTGIRVRYLCPGLKLWVVGRFLWKLAAVPRSLLNPTTRNCTVKLRIGGRRHLGKCCCHAAEALGAVPPIGPETILSSVTGGNHEMLRLEVLAKHCANIQLPCFGAYISRARRCSSVAASKRLVASVPEDRLQQAQRAIEAMSNLQAQQQPAAPPAAVSEQDILDVMQKTKSKRKHKRDLPLDPAHQEAIRQKIAASMARKAAKAQFQCPACGVTLTRIQNVLSHMDRCCQDLFPAEVLQQADNVHDVSQLQQILAAASALENSKRRQALEITFLSHDSSSAVPAVTAAFAAQPSSNNSGGSQLEHDKYGIQATAIAAHLVDAGSSSSDCDDDDDMATAADGDDAYEASYSKRTRQRIQQAPVDIAQQMGLPLAR